MALIKNKEEDTPKERLLKGVALSDDELEQVSGGGGYPTAPGEKAYVTRNCVNPNCSNTNLLATCVGGGRYGFYCPQCSWNWIGT